MPKRIVLLLFCASLLFGEDVAFIQANIDAANKEIERLKSEVKLLRAALPYDNKWKTRTELGYLYTDGNTNAQSFSLETKAKKGWDAHTLSGALGVQYAKTERVEYQNRYSAELTYGYSIYKELSFGYFAGYKNDRFSGFDYQLYTGPEVKYAPMLPALHTLTLETGLLISQDDKHNDEALTYASYRFKGVYGWQVLENLKFEQEVTYRGSLELKENYFITAKSAFASKLSDLFSAGMSYKIDYANIAPTQNRYNDTTITANLIIDY